MGTIFGDCVIAVCIFLQLRSTSSHRCQAAGCWKKARQARCLELKFFLPKFHVMRFVGGCKSLTYGEKAVTVKATRLIATCVLDTSPVFHAENRKPKAILTEPHRWSGRRCTASFKGAKVQTVPISCRALKPCLQASRSEGRDPFIVKVKFTQKGRKLLLLDSKLEFCLFNLRIKPFGWLGENSIWSTSWKRWSIPWIAAFEIIFDDTTSPPSVFKLWHCAVNEGGTKDVPKRLKQMSPLLAKYVPFLQGEKQYEKMNTRMSKMRCYILWWLSMIPLSCVARHALSQRSACRHPQGSH